MGKVYVVASGKGGTGKTMFSVNFGATLARSGKRTVLIIELSIVSMIIHQLGMSADFLYFAGFHIVNSIGRDYISQTMRNHYDRLMFRKTLNSFHNNGFTFNINITCSFIKKYKYPCRLLDLLPEPDAAFVLRRYWRHLQ